jgi:hypothetical protein
MGLRRSVSPHLSLLLLLSLPALPAARAQDTPGAVKAAVLAKYHVTQATADHSDIVTQGDQITLLKSGLPMFPSNTQSTPSPTMTASSPPAASPPSP